MCSKPLTATPCSPSTRRPRLRRREGLGLSEMGVHQTICVRDCDDHRLSFIRSFDTRCCAIRGSLRHRHRPASDRKGLAVHQSVRDRETGSSRQATHRRARHSQTLSRLLLESPCRSIRRRTSRPFRVIETRSCPRAGEPAGLNIRSRAGPSTQRHLGGRMTRDLAFRPGTRLSLWQAAMRIMHICS